MTGAARPGGLGYGLDVIVEHLQDDGLTVHFGKAAQRLEGSPDEINAHAQA